MKLTPGQSVRIAREFAELSQVDLARLAGTRQSRLSDIQRGRVALGVERAKRLARALKVHPAALLFADYEP